MLGSNLGKKVTAGVVQDQYKQFLKNKPEEKKTLTPEERKQAKRAEMRKKGIFVKADDPDETPTILEKTEGPSHPMVYVLPEKPTIWKASKKKTTGARKQTKAKKNQLKSEASVNRTKEKKTKKTTSSSSMPSASSSASIDNISRASAKRSSKEKSKEPEKKKEEHSVEDKHDVAQQKSEEKEQKSEENKSEDTPANEHDQKPVEQKAVEEKKSEEKLEKKEEKVVEKETEKKNDAPPTAETPLSAPAPEKKEPETAAVQPSPEVTTPVDHGTPAPPAEIKKTSSNPSITDPKKDDDKSNPIPLTTSGSTPSVIDSNKISAVPAAAVQPNAFDKLDDDEFEKMTSDADEKEILKLAPRLLKVAKKHAAIEKCLTPHENDVLAKFFSGKQKLDATVLAVLDSALDKIIDYLQKNNCAVDEETKAVMKKRDKLKAAMMKEFLVSPQYLPKTWTAKFNEWKSEAEKHKNGINWFRVLFHYPKHKSFDDGPEDTFGNFRRRHRGFVVGLILGPGDVKSFDETKREDDCQGMFLDTKIIENATAEKDTISERPMTIPVPKSSKK